MEGARSSSSRVGNGKGKGKGKVKTTDEVSPLTAAETLSKIQKNISGRRFLPSARYIVHDNNSPGYGWLLPGWLAEERHMESGRVYRYYYDPSGRFYKTRKEVINAWEKNGIIVLDK